MQFSRHHPDDIVPRTSRRVRVQNNVLAYLKRITTSRTPEEEVFFENVCRDMSCICSRPDGTRKLPNARFHLEPENFNLVRDNWWHCRRLFQMLQQRNPIVDTDYCRFEFDLLLIFAAIRSTNDPVPWLLTLDGLLRRISRAYQLPTNREGKERDIQRSLVQEVILFAHGTSTAAIAVRFRYMKMQIKVPPSRNVIRWYSILHKLYSYLHRL